MGLRANPGLHTSDGGICTTPTDTIVAKQQPYDFCATNKDRCDPEERPAGRKGNGKGYQVGASRPNGRVSVITLRPIGFEIALELIT